MKSPEDRYFIHFTLRRLHSLIGVAALGGFLLFHFFINSFSVTGAEAYNDKVWLLRSLPYLYAIEIGLLGLPFAYHILYGLVIVFEGSVNLGRNPYGRNWAYVAQRVTAAIVFAFLLFHVISLKFLFHPTREYGFFEYLSGDYFRKEWILAVYAIGVAATAFHLANGLCTAAMVWGVTVGPRSQQGLAVVCAVFGVGFFGIGMGSIYGFLRVNEFVNVALAALL